MASGKACICENKDKSNWVVIHYKHNHSAFESPKYGEHPSNYSMVQCTKCLMTWSTKAKYVNELRIKESVMKDYSNLYNKGNDCDCCKNQYLCGTDGDAIGCKCLDEGKECCFVECEEN